jgi:hypothetical protein
MDIMARPLGIEYPDAFCHKRGGRKREMEKIIENYDQLSIVEKRISYLLGARLREKGKMKAAIERQNRIRQNHPVPQGWDSVSAIRKWREAR